MNCSQNRMSPFHKHSNNYINEENKAHQKNPLTSFILSEISYRQPLKQFSVSNGWVLLQVHDRLLLWEYVSSRLLKPYVSIDVSGSGKNFCFYNLNCPGNCNLYSCLPWFALVCPEQTFRFDRYVLLTQRGQWKISIVTWCQSDFIMLSQWKNVTGHVQCTKT